MGANLTVIRHREVQIQTMTPLRIPGRWREGFALDLHTVASTYLGDDEFGHPMFDTQRTELGELLYRLKYRLDMTVVDELVLGAATFVNSWNPGIDMIVPVPPTRSQRSMQPVLILADGLGKQLHIPVANEAVTRVKEIPELKNVYDYSNSR